MSAFVSVVRPDAVRLAADGAVYDQHGVLLDIVDKVRVATKLPVAVTGRGSREIFDLLAGGVLELAAKSESVDHFVAQLTELVHGLGKERGAEFSARSAAEFVIGCWSETSGPSHFYFATFTAPSYSQFPPFRLVRPGPDLTGGVTAEVNAKAQERFYGVMVEKGAAFLDTHCGDLFDLWRRHPAVNPLAPGAPPIHGIGGHVDLARITARGVTLKRVRSWSEDKVGQPIRPHVSRQERRAAEREAQNFQRA